MPDASSPKTVDYKVRGDSLEIGMHVTHLNRPWTDVPVVLQGMIIDTPDMID